MLLFDRVDFGSKEAGIKPNGGSPWLLKSRPKPPLIK